ncbi:RNA-binding protein [Lactobacillus kalixensis]|uniref:S4 domain protein n=1 Tax=Lactobacillus kalixensis DSM 16043 TaxID=1423763 RepID=A0A0R1UD45_9LACO|nr:YlmH/Sll1252 family protein [Lactobacillus kalixensis]KRL91344.1 S4 domain protein [Lactobacillus kalixensis DSM 16043]
MEKRQASSFYPHFGQDERPTVDRLVGLFNSLIFKQEAFLTDFLDPGQRDILKIIAGNDAFIQDFGGYQGAEKRRVYLSQEWENLRLDNFQVIPVQIQYPEKFTKLTHSSILGTLANSGVETDTFGDIITNGDGIWQFFVKADLVDFFTGQIDRIGRTSVKIEPIDFKQVISPEDDSVQREAIIASLRLDAILAGISKESRTNLKKEIEAGNVKLNWHDVKNSNIMVKENNVLSLRHFGRLQIINISSTRKGKFKVVLKLWQTKKKR